MSKTMVLKKVSLKAQVLIIILSIGVAIGLPQIYHGLGMVSGIGSIMGEAFLPMQLPVLLVGLLIGPYAGLVVGLISPIISYLISGMPIVTILPFMIIELMAYGLGAGLLRNIKLPLLIKVFLIQVFGRIVKTIAILIAVYGLDNTNVPLISMEHSIKVGLPGIVLQLCLVPLLVLWIRQTFMKEER